MKWTTKTEPGIVAKCREFRLQGETANADWAERGKRGHDFRIGKHWDPADKEKLEKKGRPALTINHILPILDWLCGTERQNRKDPTAKPVKGGVHLVARIWTAILKSMLTIYHGNYENSECFKDGTTTGKGWIGLYIDKTSDVTGGDLKIKRRSPFGVIEDVSCREYDINAGKFVVDIERFDKEQVEAEYPKKKTALQSSSYTEAGSGTDENWLKGMLSYLFSSSSTASGEDDDADWQKYQYEKVTTWWKEYVQAGYWVDNMRRTVMKLTAGEQLARARSAAKAWPQVYQVIERPVCVMNKTVVANELLLEHTEDPFRSRDNISFSWDAKGKVRIFDEPPLFPLIRYAAYFEDGYIMGKVDNLIDLAKEQDKRRSQFLHIINSMANSGWLVKAGTLTQKMYDKLKNFGASTGLIIKYKETPPEKIKPNEPPNAQLTAAVMSKEDMKEVSNVNTENLAYDTKSGMSGIAMMRKQQSGMVGNVIIYDNYDHSMRIMARTAMQMIRNMDLYSEDEVRAILEDEDLVDKRVLAEAAQRFGPPPEEPQPQNQAVLAYAQNSPDPMMQKIAMAASEQYEMAVQRYQRQMQQYQQAVRSRAEQMVFEAVRDLKTGRYGLAMTESPTSDTRRLASFMELLELDKTRPGEIPLKTLLTHSDIDGKEQIIEDIEAQQMQMQAAQAAPAA